MPDQHSCVQCWLEEAMVGFKAYQRLLQPGKAQAAELCAHTFGQVASRVTLRELMQQCRMAVRP